MQCCVLRIVVHPGEKVIASATATVAIRGECVLAGCTLYAWLTINKPSSTSDPRMADPLLMKSLEKACELN